MTAPKPSRAHGLLARIYSEGYCCVYGYLNLCRARGETPATMGEYIGLPAHTIRHHYRCEKEGKRSCENKPDCLAPVIAEIKKGQ
jgi:hypothetical protein